MSDQVLRLSQLQQIPVFALSNKLVELAQDGTFAKKLAERFEDVLNWKPSKLDIAINNCTRTQLVKLISVCPEISPCEITKIFRQYRYATGPSLHLYQFDKVNLDLLCEHDVLRAKMCQLIENLETVDDGRPLIKGLEIIELHPMPDHSTIVESNFRYLKRLDYVDCNEEAVTTYEMMYGFFWINSVDQYAVIHASAKKIRKDLIFALEKVARVTLMSLKLPKELQKTIPFLGEDSMTFGRLYNPDPHSPNFTSMTVKDENLQAKGYQHFEDAYSNVRQAHYKEKIDGKKKTTIAVSESASLRLYGRHTATQFRNWSIERLSHIVASVQERREKMDRYISNLSIPLTHELKGLNSDRQRHMLTIIAILAAFKRFPGITQYPLQVSALEVAESFGELVYVRIPFSCQNEACFEDGCFVCPTCESRRLSILRENGWIVSCPSHCETPLSRRLPIRGECDQLHGYVLEQADIADAIEIFFNTKLLGIIADVCETIMPDSKVDFDREMIFLSGENVIYHPKKTKLLANGGDTYNVIVNNSKATAVGHGASASYAE